MDLPHMSCRTVSHRLESDLGNDAALQTDITDREQVKYLVDHATK
jgi:hypothetical protein